MSVLYMYIKRTCCRGMSYDIVVERTYLTNGNNRVCIHIEFVCGHQHKYKATTQAEHSVWKGRYKALTMRGRRPRVQFYLQWARS